MFKILGKELWAPNIYQMEIEAPRVAHAAKPGQFIIVRIDGYHETITFTREEKKKILIDATPAFMMPVLLLGGIRFGVMREFLTPYCACEAPMHSAAYVCGTLAPFVFLGLGLSAAGIAAGYWALLCAGVINIFCAGADILVSVRALGGGVLLDHPERCGFYRFRKGD